MPLTDIVSLQTPALILEQQKTLLNIERMQQRADALGVTLRPHLKTCKSTDIAGLINPDPRAPITVSTLAEAEYFAAAGFTDILYAVTVSESKMERVKALYQRGVRVQLILDSLVMATAIGNKAAQLDFCPSVLIEIDTDGHRAGISPQDPDLLTIAKVLAEHSHIEFSGVMTHAGESYECQSLKQITAHAEQERARCVAAANVLREGGVECATVSVGSTPTALCAQHLHGVTELRAGVYVFFDLFQAGLGVCALEDISLSVLTRVLSHNVPHKRLILDAGGMALSKDRGTAGQAHDYGYGLVCDLAGKPIDGIQLTGANQEHGIVDLPDSARLEDFPIGSLVRILPNHACMTAAAHDCYHVVDQQQQLVHHWPRCNGW